MSVPRRKRRHPPVHYVLPVIFLAIPLASVYFLRGYFRVHYQLLPILNTSWLIPVCLVAWWWGYRVSFLTCAVAITAASLASSGHLISPRLPAGSYAVVFGVAAIVSWVSATRRNAEDCLLDANELLENKVRERTAELEEAHDWLKTTLASIGDGVIATDAEGRIILMNGVASFLTGWPSDAATGKPLDEVFVIVNEETRAAVESPVSKVLRTGRVMGLANHTILVSRDGREMPIDDSAAPIRAAGQKISGVVLIFREIGDRRRAEQERERLLREAGEARAAAEHQRALLHSIFMEAPAIVNIHRGPDHVFDLVHPLMRKLTGGRDITGLALRNSIPQLASNARVETLDRVYRTGVSEMHLAVPVTTAEGEQAHFDMIFNCWHEPHGTIGGVIVLAVDVTDQVRARREAAMSEERLRETARLESLGVLAGGIAHDFNNLLVGILGNASLALEIIPRSSAAYSLLGDLQSAGEKAALLTRQMLAYSGKGRFVVEPVDLSELVEEILPLISRSVPPNVVLRPLLARDLPPVEADRSQLHQVVMNLVINAAEACGDRQGMVTVMTSVEKRLQPAPAAFGLDAPQGGTYIALEVGDTGCGMSDEVKARIFDPFFTTKFTGRGLGLSAVLGIIRAHKGAISVDTAEGKGTTMRILFPAAPEACAEPAPASPSEERDRTGRGIVLVVDDEEVVRRVAKVSLERYGYTVALAANGQQALEVFRGMSDHILAVVLDLTMPVMAGEETLEELKKIDPAVRVILSTGYGEVEAAQRFLGRGLAGFLQKPYTARQLGNQLKQALAADEPWAPG